jgi:hypothetical protein
MLSLSLLSFDRFQSLQLQWIAETWPTPSVANSRMIPNQRFQGNGIVWGYKTQTQRQFLYSNTEKPGGTHFPYSKHTFLLLLPFPAPLLLNLHCWAPRALKEVTTSELWTRLTWANRLVSDDSAAVVDIMVTPNQNVWGWEGCEGITLTLHSVTLP